jgi:phosphatidylserine decarboxylase
MGWFAKIKQPLVRDLSIAIWRLFSDLDLNEAKKKKFSSLHDCFVRELKDGARSIERNPAILVSPCDGIIGACGRIEQLNLLQVKGSAYSLQELLVDPALAESYREGYYVTLRLTASMYHRFHAPHDCKVVGVTHIWGDTRNVNPETLARIEKVFCRNERVVVCTRLNADGELVTLVAVAAILVAGIRLRFLELGADPRVSPSLATECRARFRKGEEMGWFEHGSTIIVIAPKRLALTANVVTGSRIRMGEMLMHLPVPS